MDQSWKKIIKISLPMTFIGLVDILLIYLSLFWLGIFISDAEALTAIRVSGSVITMIEVILLAVVGALMIFISQSYGAKNVKDVSKGVSQAYTLTCVAGIGVTLLGLVGYKYIISIFNVDGITSSYMKDYLFVFFIGYLPIALNNFLLALPRFLQNLKLVYQGLSVLLVGSAILTPLCIYIFSSLSWSLIGGAALGVVSANLICSIFMIYKLFIKDDLNLGLTVKDLKLTRDYSIIKKQKLFIFSQVANNITFNLSNFLYIIILSYYPSDVLNVYTIAIYTYAAFGLFFQNFIGSLIPIVSQYKGSGDINAIESIIRKFFKVVGVSAGFIALLIILLRYQISEWISVSNDLIPLYADFLLIYSIPWVLNLLSLIFILTISGSGDAKGGLYLIITNMYILAILPLLVLPHYFDNTIQGVFITIALIQVLTFINSLGYYMLGKWKKVSLVSLSI